MPQDPGEACQVPGNGRPLAGRHSFRAYAKYGARFHRPHAGEGLFSFRVESPASLPSGSRLVRGTASERCCFSRFQPQTLGTIPSSGSGLGAPFDKLSPCAKGAAASASARAFARPRSAWLEYG